MLLPTTFLFALLVLIHEVTCECENKNDRNIFLWSVKHPKQLSSGYLFGTIHVPFSEVWNEVSDRVREALFLSETVLLEIDLRDDATIHKLITCKNLVHNDNAHSYLPDPLFEKIERLIALLRLNLQSWIQNQNPRDLKRIKQAEDTYNIIAGDWWRKRPIWLLFLLFQMCENLFDKSASPLLDWYIAQRARDMKKTIMAIETAEEQCNPVHSVSEDEIVFAIRYTVDFLEEKYSKQYVPSNEKTGINNLIDHYKCGTLEAGIINKNGMSMINFTSLESDKIETDRISEKLKHDIFIRRNWRMAQRIDEVLKIRANETIFCAIGAGHFFGDNSVIDHLRNTGYTIEIVTEHDRITPMLSPVRQTAKFKRVWTKETVKRENVVIIEVTNTSYMFNFIWLSLVMVIITLLY